MLQKLWNLKVVRFLCVGVCNTLLDFIMLNIFAFVIGLPVLVANLLSVCIGVSLSYYLNHHIVFRHTYPVTAKAYAKFFLITGISILCIQTAVIYLTSPVISHELGILAAKLRFTTRLIEAHDGQLTVNIAKALAVLVGMVWNYILYNKIVFTKAGSEVVDPKDNLRE